MKNILLSILLIISFTDVLAQDVNLDNNLWFKGRVEFTDGKKLNGEITYDTPTGIIAFRNDNFFKVLLPDNVTYFEFTDAQNNKLNKYVSLPSGQETYSEKIFLSWSFYEIVFQVGEVHVLSNKAEHRIVTTHLGHYGQSFKIRKKRYIETIYLVDASSEIEEFAERVIDHILLGPNKRVEELNNHVEEFWKTQNLKKRSIFGNKGERYDILNTEVLWNVMPYFHDELRIFIRKYKLNLSKIEDLAVLLSYYNQLNSK